VEHLEIYKVKLKHKRYLLHIAIEEILQGDKIQVNGVCLFRKSKYDYCVIMPYGSHIRNKDEADLFIKEAKIKIKNCSIADFINSYGKKFNKQLNTPQIEKLDSINSFFPFGFKKSTYEYVISNIKSEKLKKRFKKMSTISREYDQVFFEKKTWV
jgi:hypothetical protein